MIYNYRVANEENTFSMRKDTDSCCDENMFGTINYAKSFSNEQRC